MLRAHYALREAADAVFEKGEQRGRPGANRTRRGGRNRGTTSEIIQQKSDLTSFLVPNSRELRVSSLNVLVNEGAHPKSDRLRSVDISLISYLGACAAACFGVRASDTGTTNNPEFPYTGQAFLVPRPGFAPFSARGPHFGVEVCPFSRFSRPRPPPFALHSAPGTPGSTRPSPSTGPGRRSGGSPSPP